MGIIADAFSAQLAEMKQRSEQTDKRMFDGLARMKAMVNEMAEDISEEQSIADAILLLKEHGYKVIFLLGFCTLLSSAYAADSVGVGSPSSAYSKKYKKAQKKYIKNRLKSKRWKQS